MRVQAKSNGCRQVCSGIVGWVSAGLLVGWARCFGVCLGGGIEFLGVWDVRLLRVMTCV